MWNLLLWFLSWQDFIRYMRSLCIVDIELANISKETVVDKKVWQDEEFTNYESAISAYSCK
jgi:hypothetical protein